jgi:hypothetical protein
MSLNNYSRVKLLVDRYSGDGVDAGALGYIIEVYPDGKYEVEFSDGTGKSIAQLVLSESEISLHEPAK